MTNYSVQGGPAVPAKVVTTGACQGGPAIPVYQIMAGDGYQVQGGPGVPMRLITDANYPRVGGPALPIQYIAPNVSPHAQGGPAIPVYCVNYNDLLDAMNDWQDIVDNRDLLLTRWRRSDANPIASSGYTFGNAVWDASASLWRLFVHKQSDNKIYQQTSANGRVFGPATLALDLGAGGAWDDTSIGVPFVWCEAGETRPWRMMYRGSDSANPTKFNIGLATSLDGLTWERKDTGGNALSDAVIEYQSVWDSGAIDCGGMIKVGSTYYFYYSGMNVPRKVGLATSTDLVTWTENANNPLYIATVGEDVAGATVDNDQGRFCADIVRWDTPGGTTRYVMFVPHQIAVHTTPEIEIYTCPNPVFLQADRSFVGTMFRTATTPVSQQNGLNIGTSGTDTPRIVTDDITRNVVTGVLTGHEVRSVNAVYPATWTQELLLWDKTLAGKLEPDATLAGCKFVNIWQDLPVASPVIKLAPTGADANVRALWLPGQTGTLLDMSGNNIHLSKPAITLDSKGILLVAADTPITRRAPSTGNTNDPIVTVLEADRADLTFECRVTFTDNWNTTAARILYHHGTNTAHHFYAYITSGTTNYKIQFYRHSGGTARTANTTFPVASITPGVQYRFAICIDETANKAYFFKDGTLLNAGGTAFDYPADDYSATNPPLPVSLGINSLSATPWNGYIDEVRLSNSCRWSANYTPAAPVINYQASGQIFTGVYDAGSAKMGQLVLLNEVLPVGTSITIKARNAANIGDQSVTAGDFTLDNPTGQFHQYLITLATTDATVSPSITGAEAQAKNL